MASLGSSAAFGLGSWSPCSPNCHSIQSIAQRSAYLFLDELTYAKDWDLWLKAFYDERWPIRIVGTSSATAAIRQRGTESGVGRWDEQFLAPYLFTEYLELQNIPGKLRIEATLGETISRAINDGVSIDEFAEQRRRFLMTGGFPELLLAARRKDEASEFFGRSASCGPMQLKKRLTKTSRRLSASKIRISSKGFCTSSPVKSLAYCHQTQLRPTWEQHRQRLNDTWSS